MSLFSCSRRRTDGFLHRHPEDVCRSTEGVPQPVRDDSGGREDGGGGQDPVGGLTGEGDQAEEGSKASSEETNRAERLD